MKKRAKEEENNKNEDEEEQNDHTDDDINTQDIKRIRINQGMRGTVSSQVK